MEEKSYSIIKSRAWYNIDKKPGKGRRDLDRSGSSLPSLLFLRERSPSSADVVIIQLGFLFFSKSRTMAIWIFLNGLQSSLNATRETPAGEKRNLIVPTTIIRRARAKLANLKTFQPTSLEEKQEDC